MKPSLITDTCSLMKLLYFGDLFFRSNFLSRGTLVIHPVVYNETRKWPPIVKNKFAKELAALDGLSATPNLNPNEEDARYYKTIIQKLLDHNGLNVGRADITQLMAALHCQYALITNDGPLTHLASSLDVSIFEAEEMALEALIEEKITASSLQDAVNYWDERGEKRPKKLLQKRLSRDFSITYPS